MEKTLKNIKKSSIIFAIILIGLTMLFIAGCQTENKTNDTSGQIPSSDSQTDKPKTDTSTTQETIQVQPTEPKADATVVEPEKTETPITETKEPETPKTKTIDAGYYANLTKMCEKMATFDCCNNSLTKMKETNSKLVPPEGCAKDERANSLSCVGSYRWCEKIDMATIGESYCDTNMDCVPKPECHPKDCINKNAAIKYTKPSDCGTATYVWAAYNSNNCACVNKLCRNERYN
ncbi:MAG: hypothetical protein Q8O89_02990 [Nanoarchaeota archaeon]|nr:hypothetical protein [Nanoarchaeota archaeon]